MLWVLGSLGRVTVAIALPSHPDAISVKLHPFCFYFPVDSTGINAFIVVSKDAYDSRRL